MAFPTFAPATQMNGTQKSAFIVAVAFLSISLATSVIFNVFFFARWRRLNYQQQQIDILRGADSALSLTSASSLEMTPLLASRDVERFGGREREGRVMRNRRRLLILRDNENVMEEGTGIVNPVFDAEEHEHEHEHEQEIEQEENVVSREIFL